MQKNTFTSLFLVLNWEVCAQTMHKDGLLVVCQNQCLASHEILARVWQPTSTTTAKLRMEPPPKFFLCQQHVYYKSVAKWLLYSTFLQLSVSTLPRKVNKLKTQQIIKLELLFLRQHKRLHCLLFLLHVNIKTNSFTKPSF